MLITYNESPPLLNKLLRMHFHERKRLNDKWILLTLEQIGSEFDMVKQCKIVYTRGYWSRPGDVDNVAASIKPILDALVKVNLIEDDNSNVIHELIVKQKKYKKRELKTTVEIIPLN